MINWKYPRRGEVPEVYQNVKFAVIGALPKDGWTLSRLEILQAAEPYLQNAASA